MSSGLSQLWISVSVETELYSIVLEFFLWPSPCLHFQFVYSKGKSLPFACVGSYRMFTDMWVDRHAVLWESSWLTPCSISFSRLVRVRSNDLLNNHFWLSVLPSQESVSEALWKRKKMLRKHKPVKCFHVFIRVNKDLY